MQRPMYNDARPNTTTAIPLSSVNSFPEMVSTVTSPRFFVDTGFSGSLPRANRNRLSPNKATFCSEQKEFMKMDDYETPKPRNVSDQGVGQEKSSWNFTNESLLGQHGRFRYWSQETLLDAPVPGESVCACKRDAGQMFHCESCPYYEVSTSLERVLRTPIRRTSTFVSSLARILESEEDHDGECDDD